MRKNKNKNKQTTKQTQKHLFFTQNFNETALGPCQSGANQVFPVLCEWMCALLLPSRAISLGGSCGAERQKDKWNGD